MAAVSVDAWMKEASAVITAEAERLTQLDSAIGDGDHGTNLTRGFRAVVEALESADDQPPGRRLILAGKTLVSKVGGASGPLWGTALRRAGRSLGDGALDGPALADALDAALAGIVELGSAEPGDKTMVDALTPAVSALRAAVEAGQPLADAVAAAADAAAEGAQATVPLQARKGRASYLGERSVGHEDPGAASTALIVAALRAAVEAGQPLADAVAAAADAAAEGAQATVPLQARKGRASYLGERSVGHEDPGAASTALIIAALGRALEE